MKKIWMLALCTLLILVFAACSDVSTDNLNGSEASDMTEYEASAVKLEAEATYYNDYLGVSLSLPKGWYVYDVTEDNFASSEGLTGDSGSLDISRGDDYKYIYLIDCANLQDSRKDSHINLEIYAEHIDGVATLSEYMEEHEYYQSEYDLVLIGEDSAQISGQFFELRTFETDWDDGPYFYYLDYICEISEGYFLVIEISYWPENGDAPDYMTKFLNENLVVKTPERPVI